MRHDRLPRRFPLTLSAAALAGALALAGCASNESSNAAPSSGASHGSHSHGGTGHSHGDMSHPADGGPAPAGIRAAASPRFPVGSTVKLTADHMEGMAGATAKVTGAYSTYTYAVTYTPTTGGAPVTDHKWVVQQEIKDAGDQRLADGTPVTLLADHMAGMKGAQGTIVSSTDQTVYMVDYEAGGMAMKNHKWVVESELQPAS